MNINQHKTKLPLALFLNWTKNSSLLGNWKLKITREACDFNVKSSLKMPHVWRHTMPDEVFSAIRMYQLSFLFLLLGYHFLKMSWVFIVADWLPNPWGTSLSPPSLLQPLHLTSSKGSVLAAYFSRQPARKNRPILLHFAPEIWHCTAYMLSEFIAKKKLIKDTKVMNQPHAKGSQNIIVLWPTANAN